MNTSIYRTRTEWVPKVYEKIKRKDDYWVIGLDYGYDGMKGLCETFRKGQKHDDNV